MKTIPVALQSHLDQDATTWCFICRLETKSGTVIGFADLDTSIVYDDGDGAVTYNAENGGFTPERYQQTADLSVDNTELSGWISDAGITEAQIRAGLLDYAKVKLYRVNYMDLTAGRHEVMGTGTLGETRFSANGFQAEFRSLTQQLKQPVSKLYSLKCRVAFGSPQCGKAFVWVDGVVSAVDLIEPDRIFEDDTATEATDWYVPGVVEWVTGNNAGAQMDIDVYTLATAIGTVELSLPMPYTIQVGDTYRRRQDCNKIAVGTDEAPGDCKVKHDNLLNFRGEHLIPVADAGSSMIPGALIKKR